jgi:hypothetical protein
MSAARLEHMRLLVVGFVLASSIASAQVPAYQPAPYPPPPVAYPAPAVATGEPHVRAGLTFGIGANVGSLVADCAECSNSFAAGGIQAHVGMMVTPRLAILAEVWTMAHHDGFLTVYQNIATIAARAWVTPKVWVQGGLGAATAGYSWHGFFVDREDRTESSPGVTGAVGYEVPLGARNVIDLQLRAGTGFYSKDERRARRHDHLVLITSARGSRAP